MVGIVRRIIVASVLQRWGTAVTSVLRFAADCSVELICLSLEMGVEDGPAVMKAYLYSPRLFYIEKAAEPFVFGGLVR